MKFKLARVIMIKKIDVCAIVEKLYMVLVIVPMLYVGCDGKEDAFF